MIEEDTNKNNNKKNPVWLCFSVKVLLISYVFVWMKTIVTHTAYSNLQLGLNAKHCI